MLQDLTAQISHFRSELLMSRYEKSRDTAKQILRKIKILKSAGIDEQQLNRWEKFIEQQLVLCETIQGLVGNQEEHVIVRRSRSKGNKTKVQQKKQSKWDISPKITKNQNIERNRIIKSSKSNQRNQGTISSKKNNSKKASNEKSPKYKTIGMESKLSHEQKPGTTNIGKWGPRNKRTKSQSTNIEPLSASMKLQTPSIPSQIKSQSPQIQNKSSLFQSWTNTETVEPIKQVEEEHQNNGKKLQPDQIGIVERELILPITMPQFFKNTEARRLVICYYEKCGDLLTKLNSELDIKGVFELDSINEYWLHIQPETISKGYNLYVCPYAKQDSKVLSKILEISRNILVMFAQKDRVLMTEKPSTLLSSQSSLTY